MLAAFGLPQDIFAQLYATLTKVLPERQACAALAEPDDTLVVLIKRTVAQVNESGSAIFTLAGHGCPPRLPKLPGPPTPLYTEGDASSPRTAAVGVADTRGAVVTDIGNIRVLSQALSAASMIVAPGLALGIDTTAHEGALVGPGSAIVVVRTGPDIVYPACSRVLAHHITEADVIISGYPLGMGARVENFPRRNRLISGLTRRLLVVGAAAQSGSLTTAQLAVEQGRNMSVTPGSVHPSLAKGCRLLIKQGAKLVETIADILDELGWGRVVAPTKRTTCMATVQPSEVAPIPAHVALSTAETTLLGVLGFDPVDLDTLCEHAGQAAATLFPQLLAPEFDGRVRHRPGERFLRPP